MRRPVLLIGALAVLTGGGYAIYRLGMVCDRNGRDPNEVVLSGVVEARETDLRAEVGGRVEQVLVEEGAAVAPGAALVRIEQRGPLAELDGARAALAEAEARLALLRAGARPEQLQAAEARARLASVRHEDAAREVRRLTQLHDRGIASDDVLERARNLLDQAEASRAAARAELALLNAGARAEELDAAVAGVQRARATVAGATLRFDKTTVEAPLGATVIRRYVEPGETLAPGGLLLTLAPLDRLEVKVYLLEPHLGRVRVGTRVEVISDSWEGRAFSGRVARLATEAEFTPKNLQTKRDRVKLVFEATVQLDPTGGALVPGMPVDVVIPLAPPGAVGSDGPQGGGDDSGRGAQVAREVRGDR